MNKKKEAKKKKKHVGEEDHFDALKRIGIMLVLFCDIIK